MQPPITLSVNVPGLSDGIDSCHLSRSNSAASPSRVVALNPEVEADLHLEADLEVAIVVNRPSTACRLRRPKARQSWVMALDDSQASPLSAAQPLHSSPLAQSSSSATCLSPQALAASAELQAPSSARQIPMYMYTLDLCYAAAFTVCAEWMRLGGQGHGASDVCVARFFLLFLPLARLWDHTNALFNRFDMEDILSELVVGLMMAGAMVSSVNIRACFFEDLLPKTDPDLPPDPRISANSCRYFLLGFMGTRCVLTGFTFYVACYVADARPRAWRECLVVAVGALIAALAYANFPHYHQAGLSSYVGAILFGGAALDTLAFHVDDFLPTSALPTSALAPSSAVGARGGSPSSPPPAAAAAATSRSCVFLTTLRLRVPLDTSYLVKRHERMVIISVGALVADAIRATLNDVSEFDAGAFGICVGVPCVALLLKVFYFDLSQYHGADAGVHAVRVSSGRAAAWSLLHLPLLGTILWIGAAVQDLVDTRDEPPSAHLGERWGLFASLGSYLLTVTVQQLLHCGIGHGQRRIGKRCRLAVRSAFIIASFLCVSVAATLPSMVTARGWVLSGYLCAAAALAAFELYGRGRVEPKMETEEGGACGGARAGHQTGAGSGAYLGAGGGSFRSLTTVPGRGRLPNRSQPLLERSRAVHER
jgi:hypothetical protein